MQQLMEIALAIILAKISGELFERAGQSPILGQIVVGIILGPSVFGLLAYDEAIKLLSELGIVVLIFLVGLQTRPGEMREVGLSATVSAAGGVVVPFGLGLASALLMGYSWSDGLILGTALMATSVAITAGVLMDLGKIRTKAAELILAAAVIDDVLGLLALTFIVAVLGTGGGNLLVSMIAAIVFWAIIFPLGWNLIPLVTSRLRRMRTEGALFTVVLGVVFVFAYLAETAGLAAIVGAFLVGMILAGSPDSDMIIRSTLPLYYFLAPLFFVSVGILFDISAVLTVPVLVAVITTMGVVGKVAGCGLGARITGSSTRASIFVGVGMIPRGEVALIIAGVARTFETASGNPLLGAELFSVIAGMAMITALVTPVSVRHLARRYAGNLNEVR